MEDVNLTARAFSSVLNCPCGMNNLHQYKYEVFNRTEDNTNVVKTELHLGDVSVSHISNEGSGNPSARRDGLKIHFWCEGGHDMVLNVFQHKGCTFMEWDKEWVDNDA